MPRTSAQQRLYEELLDRHGRAIADAFLAAVTDIADNTDLQRLVAALEAGGLDDAIAALHLDEAAYDKLVEAIRSAYMASGQGFVSLMPALKDLANTAVVLRFTGRNYRAEEWLRTMAAQAVTRIVEDQRLALRRALAAGMTKGQNPRTVALDVVGRINRVTGRREGGIIGLTSNQEEWARAAADELASGDRAALENYLERKTRDRRFDRSVLKAIREGKPVPKEIAEKAVTSMRNRLLKLRGDMVGRTEAMTAIHAAKREAYLQAIDVGGADDQDIIRTWRDASDLRVRHTHRGLDGQKVRGMAQPFVSPSGALLMHPGDPNAPAEERIGCRCDEEYEIDVIGRLRRIERREAA